MIKKIVFVFLILIIAAGLRLYKLPSSPPGLYPDEAMNGNNVLESLETGDWKIFYRENFGREGLFINLQGLSVAAFGNESWALRLPSTIIGIFTVLCVYLLAKVLFNNETLALLASFFLATSFWHIIFSRIGFRAILAPFFLTWALYFLFKSLNAKYYKTCAVTGGLFYGLGFHSYIAYRATPLLIAIAGYFLYKNYSLIRSNKRIVLAIFTISAILAILPLGIYFFQNPQDFFGRTASISIFDSPSPIRALALNLLKTAGMFNVAGDFNWRHNLAGRPELFWPIGICFLVGIFISIKETMKKCFSPELILLAWLAIGLLPVILSNEGLPHALRSIIVIPPVFILSAIGAMKIYELLKSKLTGRWLPIAGYLFLSLLLFEAYSSYFVRWSEEPRVKTAFAYQDSVIAKRVNNLPKNQPKYIVVTATNRAIERDNPISLQSILFLTKTFTAKQRSDKNIYYLTTEEFEKTDIPENAFVLTL